jgi:Histidine biosynthesis protein
MDLVFMLTRRDQTVTDGLAVLDDVAPLALRHIGFKDVGVDADALGALHRRIKAMGATSYLEIVSTAPDAAVRAAQLARAIGVDRLLGGAGAAVEAVREVLAGAAIEYLPFPGRPFDHPTRLAGSADDVGRDCARFAALGCAGVDLLAYRATEADPLDLVRAARRATAGVLLVAGGIGRAEQVRALAAAGVDAFTVGSAAFDGSIAPLAGSLRSQLEVMLDACA